MSEPFIDRGLPSYPRRPHPEKDVDAERCVMEYLSHGDEQAEPVAVQQTLFDMEKVSRSKPARQLPVTTQSKVKPKKSAEQVCSKKRVTVAQKKRNIGDAMSITLKKIRKKAVDGGN